MLEILHSLSWASGFFVVMATAALLALFIARLRPAAWRWIVCAAAPVIISYCLYWYPVWLGADSSEYSSWELICVIPWSVAGILASTIVMVGVRWYLKSRNVS